MKNRQSFEYDIDGESTNAQRAIAMVQLGDKMQEYCDTKKGVCKNTDRCVISAQSSVYETAVWVEVGCDAQFRNRSLGGCALSNQTPVTTESEVDEIVRSLPVDIKD